MALPRVFAAARAGPIWNRPLQGECSTAGFAVSRLAAGLAVVRRGGIYPSRGRLRRRGVRRDEGIPPYGRFIGFAYTGKSACFRRGICGRGMPLPYMPSGNDRPHGKAGCPPGGKPIVGADSISARGVCGAAGLPGTMQASSPTGVCYNAEVAVSRLAAGLPWFVGEGHGPPAGVCGGAGFAGEACPSPTRLPATTGHMGRPDCPPGGKPIVGADSISARGVFGAAGLPGRDESRPYEQILRFAPPGWPLTSPPIQFLIPHS